MSLARKLVQTYDTFGLTLVRLALGAVMLPHGLMKTAGPLLPWPGGDGFEATMRMFTEQMHIPAPLAVLAIAAESVGAGFLILGLLTRVAALGIGVNMIVAIAMVHVHNGFFMNWFGTQHGEGFEYHILAAGMAFGLLFAGGGRWSLDRALSGAGGRAYENVPVTEPGVVPIRQKQGLPMEKRQPAAESGPSAPRDEEQSESVPREG